MKKRIEKLVLSKETLFDLSQNRLSEIQAGISGSICGNPTCIQDCGTRFC